MGACSSKPKTAEFEGSTEPAKKAEDVIVDSNTDASLVSQKNDPVKGNDGAADAGKETEQGARDLIAPKDEAPVVKESSSTAEGASSSVERELCAVDGGAGDGAVEKVGENVRDARKVDSSDGIAEGDKEVNDKTFEEGGNVGGDRGKLFEDKAVVLNESGNSDGDKGGAYIDKGLPAGEERAHESSDVTGSRTADESQNLQVAQEARGIGSPIIGVVQASEPIHVDDVSESVSLETPETTAPVDSKVSESLDKASLTGQHRGEDVVSSGEEVANLSPGSPQKAPKEKEEVLHDDLKSSHPSVSAFDDGVGQKSEVDDANRGEELPLASAHVQEEQTVEDTTKPYTTLESQKDPEERTSLPPEESVPVESARESEIAVTGNEGYSVALDEPQAPKVHENIDEGTHTKPTAEMKAEGAGEGQAEGTVDEPNESDVVPRDIKAEDVKPEAVSTLASSEPIVEASPQTDRDETDKPKIEAASRNGEKVENADAGKEETVGQEKKTSAEGDLAFEDASDVLLKVEPSTESGDRAA